MFIVLHFDFTGPEKFYVILFENTILTGYKKQVCEKEKKLDSRRRINEKYFPFL